MAHRKLKVLIADDSAFMRLLLSDMLSADKELEVVGAAVDGKDVATKVRQLDPDVVVLDMIMGQYSGIYAVKRIMKENPLPILILSGVGNTDLEPIFDALKHGAVDYMNKPSRGNTKMRSMNGELIKKIKSVARAKPKVTSTNEALKNLAHTFDGKSQYHVIVIGASTGGPSAIEEVVSALPANLNVPVIICQHMPANFIHPFVKRLNELSPLQVVVGTKTMTPRPGMVIVAPGNANMVVERKKNSKRVQIGFSQEVYPEYNNPSVNALMLSVAEHYGGKSIGVILTGMGKDGMLGLKAIKDKGGFTIAQDASTSVIYGMPKAAMENHAVCQQLGIKEIGSFLVNSL